MTVDTPVTMLPIDDLDTWPRGNPFSQVLGQPDYYAGVWGSKSVQAHFTLPNGLLICGILYRAQGQASEKTRRNVTVEGRVTVPPVDRVPWILGQGKSLWPTS